MGRNCSESSAPHPSLWFANIFFSTYFFNLVRLSVLDSLELAIIFIFVYNHPHLGSFAETKVLPNPCLVHKQRCLLNGACVCLCLNICICLCASSSSSFQFCGNKSLPQSASCARVEQDSLGHPAASIQAACPKDIFYPDWRRIIFIVAIRHSIGMDEALSISKQLHTAHEKYPLLREES